MQVVATYSSYTWGHAFFSPSLDFSDNGYNATAKSVDGVNIKKYFLQSYSDTDMGDLGLCCLC